jgi:hypothetical protein
MRFPIGHYYATESSKDPIFHTQSEAFRIAQFADLMTESSVRKEFINNVNKEEKKTRQDKTNLDHKRMDGSNNIQRTF